MSATGKRATEGIGSAALTLRPPRMSDEAQMRAAHAELMPEGFGYLFDPELAWSEQLREIERQAGGPDLPRGQVRADFLVAEALRADRSGVDASDIDLGVRNPSVRKPSGADPSGVRHVVGRVSIRHTLTPVLTEIGGHIGYAVRPAFRGRGYATQILRLSVQRLRELGVDDILVTCDEDNMASRRTIERCGGVLEDIRRFADEAPAKRRYWIEAG